MTLVYLAAGWTAGLVVSHLLRGWGVLSCATPGWLFPLLLPCGFLLALLCRRSRGRALLAGVCLAFLLGAWRYHVQPFSPCLSPADVAYHHQRDPGLYGATLEGIVVDYPDVRDMSVQYRVAASALVYRGRRLAVTGDVLVVGPRFPVHRYGDRLAVTGRLQTPPVLLDFDYRGYLAQQGIHSLLRSAAIARTGEGEGHPVLAAFFAVRGRLSAVLDRLFPEPAAALANGMLLGIESGIPTGVDEAFKTTGASHVIVISGSNIALFSGVLMAWAARLAGRRRVALPVIAVIAAYIVLIGADAAAFRAGIMGILVVLAARLGRQATAYVSLCAAALVLTAINPLSLWNLGFQLSFLATLGLMLFTRPVSRRLHSLLARGAPRLAGSQARGLLADTLAVTLAAQLTTAPLLLHTFGRFSPVSLLVNALIVPVQPVVLGGGLAALGAGLVWEPLGRVVALAPWIALKYTVAVVEAGARLPFASIQTGADDGAWALLVLAASMGVAAVWIHGRK